MKYRFDFVTNSSSSSFIIAYKKPNFDEKTLNEYPILENFDKFMKFIFESRDSKYVDTIKYDSEDEIKERFKQDYYDEEIQEEILKYFKNGYQIIEKEVSYFNHDLKEMIRDMDSEEFNILYQF